MKNLNPSRPCLMVLILNCFKSESEGALPYPTITTEYTTKPTPTVDIDPQVSWMSPSRVEHQSKFVESVIFEPQPRIMLSRSMYKVTSFIDFMPYREAFKQFETFFRKFKNNINDLDHVGPLININATKGENPGRDQKRDSLESVAKRMCTNVDWQDNSDSFEWKQIELQKFFMQSILNSLVQ